MVAIESSWKWSFEPVRYGADLDMILNLDRK